MKQDTRTIDHLIAEQWRARGLSGRRDILRLLAGASLVPLIGCGGSSGEDSNPGGAGGAAGSGGASSGSGGRASASGGAAGSGGRSGGWATGGTSAMTDKSSYPNPFTAALSACALVASTTEGPCTTEDDISREDLSEGWTGLPVRLALKIVDTSCEPLSGATVKIWHTNLEGSYSGETPNNNMCLQDQSYSSQDFFRGTRATNEDGEVYFDTCFPGWYRGRAVHVHFQVKNGSTSYRVSQLFFPEDVTEDIFTNHEEYSPYGQPDTVFSNDNIISSIPSASRERLILSVEQMTDGALLASKVLTVT